VKLVSTSAMARKRGMKSNVFVKPNGQSETCFNLCHGEKTRDEIQPSAKINN